MYKFLSVNLILITLLALFACETRDKEIEDDSKTELSLSEQAYRLKNKESCEAKDGIWKNLGRLQQSGCVLLATDAGKPCTDSKQCQVSCFTSNPEALTGSKVEGQCHYSTEQFGCRTYVRNGVAEPTLCID